MKVLFTIAGLHPESGGPSHSVPALCQALGQDGVEVEIVSLDYGDSFGQPLEPGSSISAFSFQLSTFPRTTLVDCSSAIARRMQWTPKFKRVLRERCRAKGVQLVHDTGLWLLTNHAAATVCQELNLPRIVSPRGMLTTWALRHKGWKKRIAWTLYQRRDLRTAQVLHATSSAEVQDFRVAGLRQPVAMIPNGVEVPSLEDGRWKMEDREGDRRSNMEDSGGTRAVLFLGRIHPIKGLMDLVKAWGLVRPRNWRMVIAGRDEGGHTEKLKAEIGRLKLERDFEFMGPVEGEAKWNLYRAADLFVLPSHSENFGIVVAEALASGVPVITTRGAPWEDLVTHRCGWWTEKGPEPLAAALREAMSRTDEERCEMGKRGRQLVAQKYSWPAIAVQMHAVYRWMLGEGEKPQEIED